MKQILLLLTLLLSLSAQELIPYEINGDKDSTINVVIVAEGYTASEKSKFETHMGSFVDAIFSDPVLANYRSYHNIYGVFVASNESGADDPNGGVTRDTYFDAKYNTSGIDRLLTANSSLANQVVNSLLPEQDMIMISVNYNKYGGSGGSIAVSAYSAPEIVAHEIGHSFVGLKDEYDYTSGYTAYEGINTTAKTTWGEIRWNSWIDQSTPLPTPETQSYADVVGIFEGANYQASGWYRPELNCRMKSNGVDLCAVCGEAWVLRLYELVSPLKSTSHASGSVVNLNSEQLVVTPREPFNKSVVVEWSIDGSVIFTGTTLPASAVGTNETVTATVKDTTLYVRDDPSNLLTETLTFTATGTGGAPTYELTVVNGSGSGSYGENSVVAIAAKDSSGFAFTAWEGDVSYLDNNAKSATVTMPAMAITLTATYTEIPTYELTVVNGSGSGFYGENETVTITANDSAGYLFAGWTGDLDYVTAPGSRSTEATMPAMGISLTATYRLFDLQLLPQENIIGAVASSEYADGWSGAKAIDGDSSTYWHNATDGSDDLPSEITFELNNSYKLTGFSIRSRQDSEGSRAKEYTLDVSSDGSTWTAVVENGTLANSGETEIVPFETETADVQYVRFTALSNHTGDEKLSISEFNLYYASEVGVNPAQSGLMPARIMHTNGAIRLAGFRDPSVKVSLFSLNGRQLFSKEVNVKDGVALVNLPSLNRGVVLIQLEGVSGTIIRKLAL